MPAPTTLSELIALYLARCRIEGLSPRTQRAYSETLARFQRSVAAQGVPDAAAAVETATVIRYCETFQARRPATRHRYFREVRCFFNWCVAAGFLDHTPFRGLRNVRLPSELVPPFRPPELARLVAACDPASAVGRRDAAVVLLFLDTGIRCAELSALDLADCDLPRGRLLIRHGKGNKQRVVPFARRCQAALETYLAVRGRRRRARSCGPSPGPAGCGPACGSSPTASSSCSAAADAPPTCPAATPTAFAIPSRPGPSSRTPANSTSSTCSATPAPRWCAATPPATAPRTPPAATRASRPPIRCSGHPRSANPHPASPPTQPVLALKLHCSFLSGSPSNSAGPRSANRLQMLPKQRVEGSNPFSRSNHTYWSV